MLYQRKQKRNTFNKKISPIYSVSQKIPPGFFVIFPKRLAVFSPNFRRLLYTLLSTLDYKYPIIQLSPTMAKLCQIKCDQCAQRSFRPMVDILSI